MIFLAILVFCILRDSGPRGQFNFKMFNTVFKKGFLPGGGFFKFNLKFEIKI